MFIEEDNQTKSDVMVCNSLSYNTFQHKKYNDLMFLNQMQKTPVKPFMIDPCLEDKLKPKDSRECDISLGVMKRGGNNENCQPRHFCKGFDCYNSYHLDEYLITPCPENTWVNHVISNASMGCSKKHQFFMNVTKRK